MKKLTKIKLQDATVLNDNEMKMVFGGKTYYCYCNELESSGRFVYVGSGPLNDMAREWTSECQDLGGFTCVKQ